MHSESDVASVYGFLNNTPEGSLRKMLIGGPLTEVHLRLLLKLAKNSSESDFVAAFNNETLPNMRYSPAETKIKENFWKICKDKLSAMGLLSLGAKAA